MIEYINMPFIKLYFNNFIFILLLINIELFLYLCQDKNFDATTLEENNFLLHVNDYANLTLIASTSKKIYIGIPPELKTTTEANFINATSILTLNENYILASCLQDSLLTKININDGNFKSLIDYNSIPALEQIPITSCSLSILENTVFIVYTLINYYTNQTNVTNIAIKLNITNRDSDTGPELDQNVNVKYFTFPQSTIKTNSTKQILCEPLNIINNISYYRLVCVYEDLIYVEKEKINKNFIYATHINENFDGFQDNIYELNLYKYNEESGFNVIKIDNFHLLCLTKKYLFKLNIEYKNKKNQLIYNRLSNSNFNAEADLFYYSYGFLFYLEKGTFMGKSNVYNFRINNDNYNDNYFMFYDYKETELKKILCYYNEINDNIIFYYQTPINIKYFFLHNSKKLYEFNSYSKVFQIKTEENIQFNLSEYIDISIFGNLNVLEIQRNSTKSTTEIFGNKLYETLISDNILVPEESTNTWYKYSLTFIVHKENEYTVIFNPSKITIEIRTCSYLCGSCREDYYKCDECKDKNYALISDSEDNICYPIKQLLKGYIYNSNSKKFEKCYHSCDFCTEVSQDNSAHKCESCAEGFLPSYINEGNCYKIDELQIDEDKTVNNIIDESFVSSTCSANKINSTGECIEECPISSIYYSFTFNNINFSEITTDIKEQQYDKNILNPPKYLFNKKCYESCPINSIEDETNNICQCKYYFHIENEEIICHSDNNCLSNYPYLNYETKECYATLNDCFINGNNYFFNKICYKEQCPDGKSSLSTKSEDIQNYFKNKLSLNEELANKICICGSEFWSNINSNEQYFQECISECPEGYEPETITNQCIEKTESKIDSTEALAITTQPILTSEPTILTTEPTIETTEPKIITTEITMITTEPSISNTESTNLNTELKEVTTEPTIINTESTIMSTGNEKFTNEITITTDSSSIKETESKIISSEPIISTSESTIVITEPIITTDKSTISTYEPTNLNSESTNIINEQKTIESEQTFLTDKKEEEIIYPEEYFRNPDQCLVIYNNSCYSHCPEGTCLTEDNKGELINCIPIKHNVKVFNDICFSNFEEIAKDIKQMAQSNSIITTGAGIIIRGYSSKSGNNDDISLETKYSIIDLGDCENLLRKYYKLSDTTELFILGIDSPNKSKNATTSVYNYGVYLENGTQLDHLTACKDSKITISSSINNPELVKLDNASYFSDLGYDIYDENSTFYTDNCAPAAIDGNDVTLSDRKKHFYPNDVSLCNDSCSYSSVNFTTKRFSCECSLTNNNDESNNENEEIEDESYLEYFLSLINYKITVCYELFFDYKSYYYNAGFYIAVGNLVFSIVTMIIFLKCGIRAMNTIIFENIPNISKLKEMLKEREEKKKEWEKLNISPNKNKKNPPKRKIYTRLNVNEIKRKKLDRLNAKGKSEENSGNDTQNKKTLNVEKKKHKNINKNRSKIISDDDKTKNDTTNSLSTFAKLKKKGKIIINKKKSLYRNSTKNVLEDNETKLKLNNKNRYLDKSNNKIKNKKKLIMKDMYGLKKYYNDESVDIKELNDIPYTQALRIDHRNWFNMFKSVFAHEIEIINIFYYKNPYTHLSIVLSIYVFELCLDLTLNCLLYTDDVVSEKYNNNGSIGFFTSLSLSFMSNIFASIIAYLVAKFSDYAGTLELMTKDITKEKQYLRNIIKFRKYIALKLTAFYILQITIDLAMCYYLMIFCTVYHKTQGSIMINYIIGISESLAISVGLSLIISLIRYLSIKYRWKSIYYTSKYFFDKF